MSKKIKYLVAPKPKDKNLTKEIVGFDEKYKNKYFNNNWIR